MKYFVIPLPYNNAGEGPEMDPSKVVGTTWEVWDELYITQESFSTKEEAIEYCDKINNLPEEEQPHYTRVS